MLKGRAALVLAALLCGVAGAGAQSLPPLTCSGPFAKQANRAALVTAFGDANVRDDDIYVGEGASEPGTLVYPDDPERRLEILWHDDDARARPALIRASTGSVWRVPAGPGELRVGMAIADVEALNGRAFSLYGFEWDYGGYASGWKGGALGEARDGCVVGLRFGPDPKADDKALRKVSGDRQLSSAAPAVRAVHPVVEQITLSWPE
ncbi:hypothetical protein [Aquabacter cavernae]|uniref:hypothetical protein n=1 Tax=Aquabacter cavernae TaxID=2496029 RepID=UPI000F8F588C|nr:hypothetical protein [Aquabacter cavernae]